MTLPSARAGRNPARFFALSAEEKDCSAAKNLPAAKRSEIGAKRHRFDGLPEIIFPLVRFSSI
jgi:hypothetical protein